MIYYNEFDPFAAAWLEQLMKAGLIPQGDIDTRSIIEVKPDEIRRYTQCHFFAGIGGWSEALRLAGWGTDRNVWTGSCPCQPFSSAGKQKGKADERHLWPVWFDLIRECRPATIFGEQVASAITHGWLDDVYQGLEAEGYACGSAVLPACSVGAPHKRDRLFFVCHSDSSDAYRKNKSHKTNTNVIKRQTEKNIETGSGGFFELGARNVVEGFNSYYEALCVLDGIPNRVGKLRGYGNAIVPQVAAEFIGAYMECIQ